MNLSSFYGKTKRNKYRVILKSGADFFVSAENCKITYNNSTCVLTGYEFEESLGQVPFHVIPSEIAAILELK